MPAPIPTAKATYLHTLNRAAMEVLIKLVPQSCCHAAVLTPPLALSSASQKTRLPVRQSRDIV